MKNELLFFKPVFKETVWGGGRLREYGCLLPSVNVGEVWLSSAHENGESSVLFGMHEGKTLSFLWQNNRELFGNLTGEKFPLLTKIIDAKDDLSVQVHPDDEYANIHENGSLGKSECWLVLDCEEDSSIIIGHNGKTAADVRSLVQQKKWREFLREVPVKKGDFFYIPAGTVHAIKGGTLILEVQQTSDITYRVYDYERLHNGRLRELHIEKSLDVIASPFAESSIPKNPFKTKNKNLRQLISCDFFSVWTLNVSGKEEIIQDLAFMIVVVLDGSGAVDGMDVKKGDSFVIPFEYGVANFSGSLSLAIASV